MSSVLNIYNLDKYDPNSFLIPLTFSINDFRNLDTRNGVFSKTIKVPGTKKNDSLLGSAFDITAEGFFDRNKRSRAIVERDGIRYLDGSVQLKKVNISQGRFHEYELILYGELSDWANLLKGRNIRDIEYSTVLYNYANLSGTWTNNGRDDEYVFPLIDYSGFESDTSATDQQVENFRPSVFVYYIFRKIFEAIDYELKPGFFARKEFRDLILPYVGEATYASQEEMDGNRLEAIKTSTQTETDGLIHTIVGWSTVDPVDPGGNFVFGTGIYTAPYDGTYNVIGFIQLRNNALSATTIEFTVYKDGAQEVVHTIEIDATSDYSESVNFGDIGLTAGQLLRLRVQAVSGGTNYTIETSFFDITLSQIPIQDGIKFDIINGVYDITQVDFIKSFCQMFNLVCLTDSRLKSVEFIHRDEFYKPISEADDWSSKLDINRLQELEQIEEGLNSVLKFEYAKDENDDNLINFRQTYNTYFANKETLLDNEFLKGSKNVANLPYAPTLMDWTLSGTIYAPKMFNTGFTKELEPRVLIYDGLQNGNWTFDGNAETQYPFAYFIKNISTPQDISLSFSNLKDVSQGLQQNDLGLVDKYYKEQIRQINNGRLYTCYLKLNPIDIVNLDFRKPKLINGVYYYLNKVEDYLAGKDVSTKVELIQVV
jgi:hypothetical protein